MFFHGLKAGGIWLLLLTLASVSQAGKSYFNCKGGSIYFAAHPVDVLLYQNPDVFHDLYVYKCVTTVLFTSGDRGVQGNYSRSVERGFENAFAWMAGQVTNSSSWISTDVQLSGQLMLMRSMRDAPNVQVLYLRLPHSLPDGRSYLTGDGQGQSLKKLYENKVETVSTTDGSATYAIDELRDLVSTILQKRQASDVRILNHKTPVPGDYDMGGEHADHTVISRLVVEVMERDKLKGNVRGYAGGPMRNLKSTLEELDYRVKVDTYFQYAPFDNATCQTYSACKSSAEDGQSKSLPDSDDIQYVEKWLEREYYVE